MNSLSFDDPTLDSLDPSLSLNDPSDIDTALLNDIDGKRSCLSQFPNPLVHISLWLVNISNQTCIVLLPDQAQVNQLD